MTLLQGLSKELLLFHISFLSSKKLIVTGIVVKRPALYQRDKIIYKDFKSEGATIASCKTPAKLILSELYLLFN